MTRRIGVVMDPIDRVNTAKDTSYALMLAAQERGMRLVYIEPSDIYMLDGRVYARAQYASVNRNIQQWYSLLSKEVFALDELDVILLRKDPPFDQEYLYLTYLLERAQSHGAWVINDPKAVRSANEKLFTAWFSEFTPPTLVTCDMIRLRAFLETFQSIIVKPLDGMGGASIFHIRLGDTNTNVILETMTQHGRRTVMAQKYLPEIVHGDKRVLVVYGEPMPYALARIPADGESRGNLAAGGRAEARPLTTRDRQIAEQLGPVLRDQGLCFVGLDIIGDYLTEINVTSPTCVQELERAYDYSITDRFFARIEMHWS
ncbi:MAG: glutathione synthase [Methylococcales bacterium]|nr:glutathione synthase [Methylococcales bacterium]